MTTTIFPGGIKIRTASTRRYIVAIVTYERGVAKAATIYKRSDSRETAKAHARRYGPTRISGDGAYVATVIDRVTGEEVGV